MESPDLQSNGFLSQEGEPPDLPYAFPPSGFVPGPSAVPGIEVFVPVGSVEKHPDIVDFPCPRCGATRTYSVVEGNLVCEHCGYSETPQSNRLGRAAEGFEFDVQTLERSEKGWGEERKELACQRCGGVVSTPPDIIAYTCPFCGSNTVLFREPLEDVLRPRYLIPFKVSPQTCRETVRNWLGSSWMLPPELRESASPEKFQPIYIPYWVFNATASAVWMADVAHDVHEVHERNGQQVAETSTNWREEQGKVRKNFVGLLVPGTTHLNMATLGRVDYYKIEDLVLYEPRYLAGMKAQSYDLPLDEAWRAGRHIMRVRTRQACLDKASSSSVRNFEMTLDFSEEQWRYILAPIYTSVYHYQEKTFQILVNGQTGDVAGPRPVDWEKVWLTIAAILTPGLLLILVGWYFSTEHSRSIFSPIGIALLATGLVLAVSIILRAKELERV